MKATVPVTSLAMDWLGPYLVPALISLVHNTVKADAKSGYADTIAGFYWYQGESDAGVPAYAAEYRKNLLRFIQRVRTSLHIIRSAPFVLVKESLSCGGCIGNAEVRAADDSVAVHRLDVLAVDTAALARTGGGVHLSNVSELELGRRLAVASESLMP